MTVTMPTGFEKIIAFVRRTGDRCVVVDAAGNPAYVVLPLEEYERLMAKPGENAAADPGGLLDAIAADAAAKNAAATPALPHSVEDVGLDEIPPLSDTPAAAEPKADRYYFEPIE